MLLAIKYPFADPGFKLSTQVYSEQLGLKFSTSNRFNRFNGLGVGGSELITSLIFSLITLSAALYKELLSLLPTTLSSSAASRLW
jgi:hypothetical protein